MFFLYHSQCNIRKICNNIFRWWCSIVVGKTKISIFRLAQTSVFRSSFYSIWNAAQHYFRLQLLLRGNCLGENCVCKWQIWFAKSWHGKYKRERNKKKHSANVLCTVVTWFNTKHFDENRKFTYTADDYADNNSSLLISRRDDFIVSLGWLYFERPAFAFFFFLKYCSEHIRT